jgi:hypothetical protein
VVAQQTLADRLAERQAMHYRPETSVVFIDKAGRLWPPSGSP